MRNPAYFQGARKRKSYFEGWYFKCISADRRHAIALIPGLAIDPQGRRHSFIQIINAASGKTWYHEYPADAFAAASHTLQVQVGPSTFDRTGLDLGIDTPAGRASGQLRFDQVRPFPVSTWRPSIMGPFQFLPFMECYHAIIHLSHQLRGTLTIDGEVLDFNGGAGYIEKDYGRSFPSSYLWLQASHFKSGDASFVFSRARIPFLGREFPGFFAYLSNFQDLELRFATYNHSELTDWQVDPVQGICSGRLRGPAGTLDFSARMAGGGRLRAPVDGLMDREIVESITATVQVRFTDREGKVRFDSQSGEAGMEISLA
jgi:hypothetical protein